MAYRWYRVSAEAGDAHSLCRCGDILMTRDHDSYNPIMALGFFVKAAEQGNVMAQKRVANLLSGGSGVQENQEEANKWYRKAAATGDVESSIILAKRLFEGVGVSHPDYAAAYDCLEKVASSDVTGQAMYELGMLYCTTRENNKRYFSIDKAQYCFLQAKKRGVRSKEMDDLLEIFTKIIQDRKPKQESKIMRRGTVHENEWQGLRENREVDE